MRLKVALLVAAILLPLSACGPIIGSMMASSNGIKEFRVIKGSLDTLRPGAKVAVLGPFATTQASFEICRGEEAAAFVSNFNLVGLFPSELAMANRLVDTPPRAADWRGETPSSVQKALGLSTPPEVLMSATILSREMVPAPAKGIIMKVAYRLDFLELTSGKETSLEISVQQMFKDAVPASVEALVQHVGRR